MYSNSIFYQRMKVTGRPSVHLLFQPFHDKPTKYNFVMSFRKVSEYDQELLQAHTANLPTGL